MLCNIAIGRVSRTCEKRKKSEWEFAVEEAWDETRVDCSRSVPACGYQIYVVMRLFLSGIVEGVE